MTKQKELIPVLAYLRVSTERQERSGLSLEDQRRTIDAFCARKGWQVVEEYQDAASGKTLARRPGLKAALELMEDKTLNGSRPQALVVAKLDRLARSTLDYARMIERSQENDWNLALVEPEIDLSTSHGRAMAGVIMVFAQLERELIGERVKAANRSKRAKGLPVGRKKGTREIPAAVVKRIHALRADGMSYARIAATLDADGVPTARDGKWAMNTIRRVCA